MIGMIEEAWLERTGGNAKRKMTVWDEFAKAAITAVFTSSRYDATYEEIAIGVATFADAAMGEQSKVQIAREFRDAMNVKIDELAGEVYYTVGGEKFDNARHRDSEYNRRIKLIPDKVLKEWKAAEVNK